MFTRVNVARRRFLGIAALGFAAGPLGLIESGKSKSPRAALDLPVEGNLPSLGQAIGWLNSPPLSAHELRGKVVLVNFCTYTCINWLRSLPYVRAWAEKYKNHGLVVIGAHTPEFAFEADAENVRRSAEALKISHPVAIDSNYAIWRAFDNEYWPALYFADAEGHVRHQRFGEGDEYQLIRQPAPIADRLFEVEFLDPGVEAFAFTFG